MLAFLWVVIDVLILVGTYAILSGKSNTLAAASFFFAVVTFFVSQWQRHKPSQTGGDKNAQRPDSEKTNKTEQTEKMIAKVGMACAAIIIVVSICIFVMQNLTPKAKNHNTNSSAKISVEATTEPTQISAPTLSPAPSLPQTPAPSPEPTPLEELESQEIEPNDEISMANAIEMNKQYQGDLDEYGDRDYYKITLDEPGKVSITVEHPKVDSASIYCKIALLDGEENETIIDCESNGATAKKDSDAARVLGGTYYIRIEPGFYDETEYSFTVNYEQESDEYEKEKNDAISAANAALVNKEYIGNIQCNTDVDYYKLTVGEKGKVGILFKHTKMDTENELWRISLIDGVEDNTILNFSSPGTEAEKLSDAARIPPGEYYLKIEPRFYSNADYSFTVNYQEEDDTYESEQNNSFSSANGIALGQAYIGNAQNNIDEDYYKFDISQATNITVSFAFEAQEPDHTYWKLSLIEEADKGPIEQWSVSGKESSFVETIELMEPGTYYIKVTPSYFLNSDYTILVN